MAICSLLLSCSEIKDLALPKGVDKNFRSGEIKYPYFFNPGRVEVMEYRVIKDSVISSNRYDTTVTFGLILPRSSIVLMVSENKMIFGTDSLQCIIRYTTTGFQSESSEHSILTDIIVKPDVNDPNYDPSRKTITPYKRSMAGTIQTQPLKEEVQFLFDHEKADKNFDSANIRGYLRMGNDSFYIRPLYKEVKLRGKNVKPMQMLQGYSLMKGDSLVAFLQHAPLVKTIYTAGLKDVLYLNTNAPQKEQLLVAAFFSLVSRLVLTTGEQPLY